MLLYCASLIIPGFYATEVGIGTKVIGTVMVVSRLFDAAIDPVIGHLSDRTSQLGWSRRPWLVAGAIVSSIAVAFLYAPSPGVGAGYYLAWTLCLYLGWTMAIIPYDAWGADISREYAERSRIFTFRSFAYYFGSLLFLSSPFLGVSGAHTFNRDVLQFNARLVAVLFLVSVPLALRFAPHGRVCGSAVRIGLWSIVGELRRNLPMLRFLLSYSISGISLGVFLALSYIYVVNYLRLPEAFPVILVGYAVANLVAVPPWLWIIRRIGRHRAWAVGVFLDALFYPPLAFLSPGPASFLPALILIGCSGFADAVSRVASDAILGDIVDYAELKTGKSRTANYYAVKSLVTKSNVAIGGGLAFLSIGWFGFDPMRTVNPPHAVHGFLFTLLIVPSILYVLAGILMWRFPINQRRQNLIRRRLEARASRGADRIERA